MGRTPIKKNILEVIRQRVVVFDGAMGTMLLNENLDIDETPPVYWNVQRPEVVRKVYWWYYEAGADVVQTNTFGGNKIRLAEKNIPTTVYDLNYAAAKSLKQLCPDGKFAAGNIGPTGKPFSSFRSKREIEAGFEEQVHALVDGGVDLLSIETMYSLQESLCALRVAKKISTLPVSTSMTFQRQSNGFFTDAGESLKSCIDVLSDFGSDIVGANCMDSSDMIEATWEMRKSTFLPILVQPNAGSPVKEAEKLVYKKAPSELVQDCLKMVNLGADIVGGCCGTSPEFIRSLCDALATSK